MCPPQGAAPQLGAQPAPLRRCTTTSTSPNPRRSGTTTRAAPRSSGDADAMMDLDAGRRPQGDRARRARRRRRDRWRYQRYIKDYLRTIAAIDDDVGRTARLARRERARDNTIVVYTSDQGFFLGDHGWFDKRMMYEESLAMPFLLRYPAMVGPGRRRRRSPSTSTSRRRSSSSPASTSPTSAGHESSRRCCAARRPTTGGSRCTTATGCTATGSTTCPPTTACGPHPQADRLLQRPARTARRPRTGDPPEWELYDLVADPAETHNVLDDPANRAVAAELHAELRRLQTRFGDAPHPEAEQTLLALFGVD